ncbi:MAG TPA: aldo/keto reductase [Steroidobacteraceae bacterium]
MWRLQPEDPKLTETKINAALEAGITLFDTADIYGVGPDGGFGAAETQLGRVLADTPALRRAMTIATKGGIVLGVPYDSSARYLVSACEASLRRLGIEQIDLYQIHRPDNLAHPAEVASAFEQLRRSGKIRAAGVSNYTAAQTRALQAHLPFALASIQPEFSPLVTEPLTDGTLDLAEEFELAVLAWSPLAGGRLMDPAPGEARAAAVVAALDSIATAHGVSRMVAALGWLVAHPIRPVPIIGSQNPDRIREAMAVLDLRLERKEWYAVLTAARGSPLP